MREPFILRLKRISQNLGVRRKSSGGADTEFDWFVADLQSEGIFADAWQKVGANLRTSDFYLPPKCKTFCHGPKFLFNRAPQTTLTGAAFRRSFSISSEPDDR
jgi:hypothetical protein